MNTQDLKKTISQGETTTVQLKLTVDDAYKIATEMVAFSNSFGGQIIIGVDDKSGEAKGLSYEEIQKINSLLSNASSDCVKPAILIHSETVQIDGKNLIVATIAEGKDKPYKDNKGIIWVKNGSDKRKVFSNAELRVMMQSCGNISADSDSVSGTSIKDIDIQTLKLFLFKRYENELKDKGISINSLQSLEVENMVSAIDKNFTIEQLLTNISILDNKGQLTLTGLLLLSIFNNRIELHSPGILPDSVTEEKIKEGISVPRNKFLFDNAKYLLPYTGIGSGIMRVLQSYDKISFNNNIVTEEFVITMMRDETLVDSSEGVNKENERVNCGVSDESCGVNGGVNKQSERVKDGFELVNVISEGVNDKSEGVNFGFEGVICGVNDGKGKNERVNCAVNEESCGVNCGVNKIQLKILDLINENQYTSVLEISKKIEKSQRTAEYNIKELKDKGIIERFGSDKTGGYRIIQKNNRQ